MLQRVGDNSMNPICFSTLVYINSTAHVLTIVHASYGEVESRINPRRSQTGGMSL